MIKYYWKQAWELLKQHKLFSVLYITGAGLAIAMTMVVFVAHYIRVAPVYPETNRAETWVLKSVTVQRVKTRGSGSWQSSHQLVRDWWYPMQEAEQVSAVYNSWELDDYIQRENLGSELNVKVKYTDPAFFRIFQFSFLAGKPFSQADFESGIMNAVVGEDLARRLFGHHRGGWQDFQLELYGLSHCGSCERCKFPDKRLLCTIISALYYSGRL